MAKTGGAAATKQTASPKRLNKAQLLEALKRRETEVTIGDVGTILVQGLTLDDFSAIREMGADDENPNVGELFKKVVLLGCLEPSFDLADGRNVRLIDVVVGNGELIGIYETLQARPSPPTSPD